MTARHGISQGAAAVLFDNDGLLLDTEILWTRAEIVLFERRGATFTMEDKLELIGSSGPVAEAKVERMLGLPGQGAALMAELHELVMEEALRGVEPMPGALELLDRIEVPVGVASNSPRPFVERTLAAAGLRGRFGCVLSADDVAHPKPAPDLYVELARGLGADPADCVALEDSATGVAAARAAGAFVIGVPSLEGVVLDEADLVAPSLSDPRVLARLA
jgi:HAD superfamily hydrolase (TIGR01509 family)